MGLSERIQRYDAPEELNKDDIWRVARAFVLVREECVGLLSRADPPLFVLSTEWISAEVLRIVERDKG